MGQTMPKLRIEAPSALEDRSQTRTDKPRLAADQAWARPTIPAPTITTSALCMQRSASEEVLARRIVSIRALLCGSIARESGGNGSRAEVRRKRTEKLELRR